MGKKKTFQGNPNDPVLYPPAKKSNQKRNSAASKLEMEPNETALSQSPSAGPAASTSGLDMHELMQMPPLAIDNEPEAPAEVYSASTVPHALQAALDNPEAVAGAVANSTLATSLLTLEEEAAQQSLVRNQEMTSGKGTEPAYARQLERYENQWALREARRAEEAREKNVEYSPISAHPITPMKVAIYAEEERKRERLDRHGNPIANTCISWRTVTQAISALENYRFTHQRKDPRYVNCPEAQISLRDDPDIRSIEKAARQSDAQRQDGLQELKANGVQSQTFTEEQFLDVSVGLMSGSKATPVQMVAYLRDRTMLLTSGTMALRGDNVRSVRLSDVTSREVPLVNIAHDFKAKAVIIFSNQGKTNVNGRIDEHSAFRHRDPELCMLDALGMYFFALYHIEKRSRPDFAPDWKHEKATQIGFRDWYNILMFPGGKSDYEEMNDAYHRKRVNHFKALFDIFCEKATHGGRVRAANVAIQNGATVDGTKSLGNWSQSGSFRACYNRVLPTDAMLALAGFNGERKDEYFIARDELKPPEELLTVIFPWIEEEEEAYQQRLEDHGNEARDNALVYFLNLLRYLRTVLLQDVAVMSSRRPDLFLLRFAPFNTDSFHAFASKSSSILDTVEAEAKANLAHLPERYAASVSGALKSSMIKQEQHRRELEQQNQDLRSDIFELVHFLADCLPTQKSKKRKFSEALTERLSTPVPLPRLSIPSTVARPVKRPHLEPPQADCSSGQVPQVESQTDSILNPSRSADPSGTSRTAVTTRTPAISGTGTVYSYATFPLSTRTEIRAVQTREISVLEKKILPERLQHNSFEWVEDSPHHGAGEWLPEFHGYWKPSSNQTPTLKDIWMEHERGIGHRFSIKELKMHWGVRWRRNTNGLKVEGVRREKVVELVRRLIAQDGWNEEKALRFLEAKCPIPSKLAPHLKSLRAFITYLGSDKNTGIQKIVDSSIDFH